MFKTLYTKLAGTTIIIMIISGLLSFILSNYYYQHKFKPENDEKITKIALEMAHYIEQAQPPDLHTYLNNIAEIGYHLYLVDEDHHESFFGDPFRETTLPAETIDLVLNGEIYHGIKQFPQRTFVTGFFANELINSIGVPFTHADTQYGLFIRPNLKLLFNEMHFLLAWMLLFAIVISIILVSISTKYIVSPISKLTKATETVKTGNFNVDLNIRRHDEIGRLARSFTNMAEQLDQLDDMRHEFITNISHDIQTPLANIKGYVNLLENDDVRADEKDEYITVINDEINRLSRLTKQLLLLASLDREEDILKKTDFSLSEQIKDVIHNHGWQLQEKKIMISYTLPEVTINGDPTLLYNVWENLLTNAIKYNHENGTIDVKIIDDDEQIEVRFTDSGIGFSEEVKKRLFDRFYREDSSRMRKIEGTGLGLAIVALIVELHNGDIQIESKKQVGSTFSVLIPK